VIYERVLVGVKYLEYRISVRVLVRMLYLEYRI